LCWTHICTLIQFYFRMRSMVCEFDSNEFKQYSPTHALDRNKNDEKVATAMCLLTSYIFELIYVSLGMRFGGPPGGRSRRFVILPRFLSRSSYTVKRRLIQREPSSIENIP